MCPIRDDMGMTLLSERAEQLLWLVGGAGCTGNPTRQKDLMMVRKQGAYQTVRRHIAQLVETGLITHSPLIEKRGRQFLLSEHGRDGFARMTRGGRHYHGERSLIAFRGLASAGLAETKF